MFPKTQRLGVAKETVFIVCRKWITGEMNSNSFFQMAGRKGRLLLGRVSHGTEEHMEQGPLSLHFRSTPYFLRQSLMCPGWPQTHHTASGLPPPECWDYQCMSSCMVHVLLEINLALTVGPFLIYSPSPVTRRTDASHLTV